MDALRNSQLISHHQLQQHMYVCMSRMMNERQKTEKDSHNQQIN